MESYKELTIAGALFRDIIMVIAVIASTSWDTTLFSHTAASPSGVVIVVMLSDRRHETPGDIEPYIYILVILCYT